MSIRGFGKKLWIVLAAVALAWTAAAGAQDPLPPEQIVPTVRQPTLRKIHREKDALALERIELYRAKLPEQYRRRNNFAWACAKIKGLDKVEYFAHSGIQDFKSLSAEETNRIAAISLRPDEDAAQFKILCVNQSGKVDGPDCWYRSVDTEFKILEDIASRLPDPAVTGRLRLYTELYPCPSCRGVMQQFLARYTNVQMQVLYRRK